MIDNNAYRPLILAVDDISRNLQLLGNLLDNDAYRIAFATSGKETLELLDNISPDIILLDIMMPEMDGYEVCEKIKSNPATADIPIIFITGKAERDDLIKGFQAGAVDYVTKPFNSAELLSRVATHIELKLSRDKLKKYNEDLEKLNASKNKFFSIIAHDLRSPFSGFLGLTQLMNEDLDTLNKGELQKIAENMHKAANKLYEFLENLLEWSRSQMNTLKIEFQDNKLFPMIDAIEQLSKEALVAKEIKFINSVSPSLSVNCDYHTLSTCFRNLITNAIKFTPNNGKITIASYEDDDSINVIITDTGVGIPKGNLDKLFEIDKKIVTAGTNKEKGSGLGLLLTKEFIEKNNGILKIESEVNKGTKAIITLKNKKNN